MHPLYFFCRPSIGDGGMDLTGSYKKRQLVVQCKNYSASIGLHNIYVFEGVLSRYAKETTFGVFVVSKKNGYTKDAIERAKTSQFEILLTNSDDLITDINKFTFKYQITYFEFVNHELDRLREKSQKMDRDELIIGLLIMIFVAIVINILLTLNSTCRLP